MIPVVGTTSEASLPAIEGGRPARAPENFIVFGAPVLGEAEIAGVVDCLRRGWISTGPRAREFESKFAKFKNAPHAVAVNSGTAALHLALVSLGLVPGDEVVTTSMTFCATVNAIIHSGAMPVLADCDPLTFNLTAEQIERRITPRTKVILVVHMCGRCCDMDAIMQLARARNLAVVEDCAHAVESSYHGAPAGTMGDIGCFSFYATKNLTTTEGGIILTRSDPRADRLRLLANHGITNDAWSRYLSSDDFHYEVVAAGFKYNLPDINAAIGLAQLRNLSDRSERRAAIWKTYNEEFVDLPVSLPPPEEPGTRHARHLYTLLLRLEELSVSRDHVLKALRAENIGAGVHFRPIHAHRFYREHYPWRIGEFPNAEYIGERTISLPLSGGLDDQSVSDVCRAVRRILRHYRI